MTVDITCYRKFKYMLESSLYLAFEEVVTHAFCANAVH